MLNDSKTLTTSQLSPENPSRQVQRQKNPTVRHSPPFSHGLGEHGSGLAVVSSADCQNTEKVVNHSQATRNIISTDSGKLENSRHSPLFSHGLGGNGSGLVFTKRLSQLLDLNLLLWYRKFKPKIQLSPLVNTGPGLNVRPRVNYIQRQCITEHYTFPLPQACSILSLLQAGEMQTRGRIHKDSQS